MSKYVFIIVLLEIAAAWHAAGRDNSHIERVLQPRLCTAETRYLKVEEDRSYRCVGGRIKVYIDNAR